jgi:hypothetical protein
VTHLNNKTSHPIALHDRSIGQREAESKKKKKKTKKNQKKNKKQAIFNGPTPLVRE